MKKGIVIITIVWILINFISFLIWGVGGSIISTYTCAAIVWVSRKQLISWLKI